MKRRKFFKNIGATLAGAALLPGVVIKAISEQPGLPGFNIKELDERIKQLRREWHIKQARKMYQEHLEIRMVQDVYSDEVFETLRKLYGHMDMIELLKITDRKGWKNNNSYK